MKHWRIQQAAWIIQQGGIVAYPTEAVYGLGCDPRNEAAVLRLLALKHRPLAKGLILIASEISQLDPYVDLAALPSSRQSEILATWPGPITWLLPSRPTTPLWLRGQHATLAVRVTDHPLAAGLCRQCHSALVSTSANRTGHAPARTALQVRRQFGDRLDFILCGALGQKTSPTEIRDGLTGAVIRQA